MRIPESIRETTGFLIAQVCRLRRARAHAAFDRIGVHRGQLFALRALWESEGISQSELAEQLGVQPATVTNGLQRMERAGLVERRRDAQDQRVWRIYLTDEGKGLKESVQGMWRELEQRTFAGFTEEEQDQLGRFLRRIRQNLQDT